MNDLATKVRGRSFEGARGDHKESLQKKWKARARKQKTKEI
jgi:hypothetical protein